MHAVEMMHWETFTRLFYQENFLQSEHDTLRHRLERLRQVTMIVAEYRSEFIGLEASHQVSMLIRAIGPRDFRMDYASIS